MAERFGTTMERHMRDLQNIRDLALQAGAYGAAVQAEYRRGQALGTIYIDRKEIRHGTIDSMSKEEVMRKLEEIKRLYGDPGRVIDVTPKEIEQAVDVKAIEAPGEKKPRDFAEEGWSEEGRKLRNITREAVKEGEDAIEARKRALSEIEGKPASLPHYPD
jgi:hypothetical protein